YINCCLIGWQDGDIINIDVTVYLNVTRECLQKAISICAPGVEFNRIGKTIHDHADKFRYGVVRQFVGHGVGRVFHADPVILHFKVSCSIKLRSSYSNQLFFAGNNERGCMLLGQTFTIGNS
ncbi:hypothetical protein GW17_00050898, partial [Ensete ventricosum]